jgi:DNA-binding NarL/FixJ family response regulator
MDVFLVEDSPPLVERLKEMLGALPRVRIVGQAAGAREAVAAILAARPDLVVLDLKLAQGTGFDVLSAVHRSAPDIELYMLSNFAAEPYRQRALSLGARAFFDKSTEFQCIRDVVARRVAGQS